jgi:hypothetical protein
VVLGVKRRGNGSYELVLDRDLTPARHRAYIFQGAALTCCAALLPMLLVRILLIAEGNKKRALLIRRYYEKKLKT